MKPQSQDTLKPICPVPVLPQFFSPVSSHFRMVSTQHREKCILGLRCTVNSRS